MPVISRTRRTNVKVLIRNLTSVKLKSALERTNGILSFHEINNKFFKKELSEYQNLFYVSYS